MWNKRISVSQHARDRYIERNITHCKVKNKEFDIYHQVKLDLRPLNVVMINKLKSGSIEIITKQGKVYIAQEKKDSLYVQTVYQKSLKKLIDKRKYSKRYN